MAHRLTRRAQASGLITTHSAVCLDLGGEGGSPLLGGSHHSLGTKGEIAQEGWMTGWSRSLGRPASSSFFLSPHSVKFPVITSDSSDRNLSDQQRCSWPQPTEGRGDGNPRHSRRYYPVPELNPSDTPAHRGSKYSSQGVLKDQQTHPENSHRAKAC